MWGYSHNVGVEYSHNVRVLPHSGSTSTPWEYSHIVRVLPQCGSTPPSWMYTPMMGLYPHNGGFPPVCLWGHTHINYWQVLKPDRDSARKQIQQMIHMHMVSGFGQHPQTFAPVLDFKYVHQKFRIAPTIIKWALYIFVHICRYL